jgi:hypothetical protein
MKINIININLTSISSEEPEENVPCGSCTLCCEKLSPYLTPEEVTNYLIKIQEL